MGTMNRVQLDALVEEATVDSNGEDEQVMGLFTTIADNLATPFQITVLGLEVTVEDIDVAAETRSSPTAPAARFGRRSPCWIFPCRRHRRTAPSGSRRIGTGPADVGKPKPLPPRLQAWVDARKRHRLSHAHVQMARELGLNPTKLGKLDNHQQEPWKAPLPQYIEHLYAKQFGRERPDIVRSIEETARLAERRRAERTARSTVEEPGE